MAINVKFNAKLELDDLQDMIVDLTYLLLFTDHHYRQLASGLDANGRDLCIQSYNRIRSNTPLPVTATDKARNIWHLDVEENLKELEDRCGASDQETCCLMCAVMEARITWNDWTTPTPMMRAYYRLLETAGYPVSDEERAALADGVGEA